MMLLFAHIPIEPAEKKKDLTEFWHAQTETAEPVVDHSGFCPYYLALLNWGYRDLCEFLLSVSKNMLFYDIPAPVSKFVTIAAKEAPMARVSASISNFRNTDLVIEGSQATLYSL